MKLTGADGVNPWPRDRTRPAGYQLDARFVTLQEQALGALLSHAEIQSPPQQRLLDDLASFQRMLFTNERVRALSDAMTPGARRCRTPIRGSMLWSNRAKRCSLARARSVTAAPGNRRRSRRSSASRHLHAVPATGRHRLRPRASTSRRARRVLRATRGPTRSRCRRHDDPADQLGSWSRTADGIRRRPCRRRDDWNKLDMPGLRGMRHTAPYFHNNSADTLEEVVDHYIEFFKRVQVERAARRRAAGRIDRRRELRSCAEAGRARGAAGVPAKL